MQILYIRSKYIAFPDTNYDEIEAVGLWSTASAPLNVK